jgi:hypothetical protein
MGFNKCGHSTHYLLYFKSAELFATNPEIEDMKTVEAQVGINETTRAAAERFVQANRNPLVGTHLTVDGNYLRIKINDRNENTAVKRAKKVSTVARLVFWNVRADSLIHKSLAGTGFTYGYIGNLWTDGRADPDDRAWSITAPHPGRIGTLDDQVGGSYSTDDRAKLAPIAAAIRAGYNAAKAAA